MILSVIITDLAPAESQYLLGNGGVVADIGAVGEPTPEIRDLGMIGRHNGGCQLGGCGVVRTVDRDRRYRIAAKSFSGLFFPQPLARPVKQGFVPRGCPNSAAEACGLRCHLRDGLDLGDAFLPRQPRLRAPCQIVINLQVIEDVINRKIGRDGGPRWLWTLRGLYDRKTPITAAELLNDRVIPFFDEHEIPLCRVLTDRGTEYCGNPEHHEYELYLAIEDIDHTRTKARSPQTNGICERFHKTVLDEFYRISFRKRIYATIEQLQADLDAWMAEYNQARPHQGRWCYGKTPMQAFLDTLPIQGEKHQGRVTADFPLSDTHHDEEYRLSGQIHTSTR
jgi:Integrase core domain